MSMRCFRISVIPCSRTQFGVFIVDFRGLCATDARRSSMQTLLVRVGCGGVLVLLPGVAGDDPGRRSLRLAGPGLHYAALSGLKKTETGRP